MPEKDSQLLPLISLEVVPNDLATIERASGSKLLAYGKVRKIEPWTPAAAYLASLSTIVSRRSMVSSLNKAADILSGKPDWRIIDWLGLDAAVVAAVLAQTVGAPSTRNKMLSALKGVARAAFRLKILPTEDYHRIRDVKGDSGSRELSGRDLKPGEIAELVRVCCDDPSAAGARDAALFTLAIVSGARRSEIAYLMMEDFVEPPVLFSASGETPPSKSEQQTLLTHESLGNGTRSARSTFIAAPSTP